MKRIEKKDENFLNVMNPGRKNNMRKKIINNKNKNCPQPQSSLSSTTIAKYNMK